MKRLVFIIALIPAALLIWLLLKPSGPRFRFYSQILQENRTLLFQLPPDYKESGLSYPVLFILDAYDKRSTYGPSFYDTAGHVNKMLQEGIPPMIVIGVVNTVRARDMIPVKTEFYAESGQADLFLDFFTKELIPHIDQSFRTNSKRILYGRSDSGLFVVYALLEEPEAFSAFIPSSPTVGHCPELIRAETRNLFSTYPDLDKTLFIIYGDNDIDLVVDSISDVVRDFHDLAPEAFRFEAKAVPSGGHIPKSSLYEGLKFVFSDNKK